MKQGHVKRQHLHVVTLDPTVPYAPKTPPPILFEYSIRKKDWENPYDEIARAKARLSWRTGLPSRVVVLAKPHLLQPGDCRFWGSAIVNSVISAASGVEPFFDEMFAGMTSAAIAAEASYYAEQHFANDDAPRFLGEA